MKVIATEKAPGAIGPYSQGYELAGLVITSGQLPVDPATGEMPADIAAQAHQSCKNVGAILEAVSYTHLPLFCPVLHPSPRLRHTGQHLSLIHI